MRWKKPENTGELTALGLHVALVALAVIIIIEVKGVFADGTQARGTIKAAVALGANDPNNLVTYLAGQKEKVEGLKKKNMFMPPPAKPKPPTVTGILGHSALINGKWHKVGETAAGAKIIAIHATEIKIMWEGKEMSLAPIKAAGSGSPGRSRDRRPPSAARPQGQPKPQVVQPATVEQPPPETIRTRRVRHRGPRGRGQRREGRRRGERRERR